MARYETAAQAINQAATECGLTAVSDPYASTDPAFIQLRNILRSCGRELLTMYEWQQLKKTYSFVTTTAASYDFPTDFDHMLDGTQWDPTTRLPLGGPLTDQDFAYLVNTNLASSTIYISFRENAGQFKILPNPAPAGQTIYFEYITRNWVSLSATPTVPAKDAPTQADDVILYDPTLISKFLKLRFLEAKGFDTTAASEQFNNIYEMRAGNNKSAPVLCASRSRSFPYLDDRNVPETNYGLP